MNINIFKIESLMNINNLFEDKIKLVFLIILLIVITVSLIISIYLSIYSHQKRLENKILNTIEIIKKLPLKHRIYRISSINDHRQQFAKELLIWRTKYEILFEKQLYNCLDGLKKIKKDYVGKNKIKFIKELRTIHNKLEEIEYEARNLLSEIDDILEIETLQRDYILVHKTLFNILKEDVFKLQMNISLDDRKITDFISSIEHLFNRFEEILVIADFKRTSELVNNISEALVVFVEILDSIPKIRALLTKYIPHKIEALKEKYVLFNNNSNDKENISEQFSELNNFTDQMKIQISQLLDDLQYRKAGKSVLLIIEKINEFDFKIKNEKSIKQLFEKTHKKALDYIDQIERSFKLVSHQLEVLKPIDNLTEYQEEVIKQAPIFSKQLTYDTNKLVMQINKIKPNQTYYQLTKSLSDLLQSSLKAQEMIEEIVKVINLHQEIENNIKKITNLIESILLQIESKIIVYENISYINAYNKNLIDCQEKLKQIKKSKIDVEDKAQIIQTNNMVEKLKNEVFMLFEKIKQTLLIDKLTQEAIVYGQKYALQDQQINDNLENAQLVYQQQDIQKALQLSIMTLEQAKLKRLK